jgi:hypothetical protein
VLFMKKILGIAALIFLLALLLPAATARAAGPLDEIKSYTVTVDPRGDGTLDISYHIDWHVLDSTSEGPLSWVKIGIPNSHADSITPLSDTIERIGYLDDNGSYVRIDFSREYKAGETVSFDFSLHQSCMYRLDGTDNVCSYSFVPGWFDDIAVDSLIIRWNKTNVLYSDSTGTEGDYLIWSAALMPGSRSVAIVRYNGGVFKTDPGMQYVEEVHIVSDDGGGGVPALAIIFIIVIIVFSVIAGGSRSRYRGGFGGRGGFDGGGHGGGCACACAGCACACACAGGGRAGCSAKNFYGRAVPTEKLSEALRRRRCG